MKTNLPYMPLKSVLRKDAVPSLHLEERNGDQPNMLQETLQQPLSLTNAERRRLEPADFLSLSVKVEQTEEYEENKPTQRAPPRVSQLCRVCAGASEHMVHIFKSDGQQQRLADKMNMHLSITVNENDRLPVRICAICVNALEACHELSRRCTQADATLRRLLQEEEKAGLFWNCGEDGMCQVEDCGYKDYSPSHSATKECDDTATLNKAREQSTSPTPMENIPLIQRLAMIQHYNSSQQTTDLSCARKTRNSSDKLKRKQFSCWECGDTLKELGEFMQHQRQAHARELRPCPLCGSIFDTELALNKHWKESHSEHSKSPYKLKTNSKELPSKTKPTIRRSKRKSPTRETVVTARTLRNARPLGSKPEPEITSEKIQTVKALSLSTRRISTYSKPVTKEIALSESSSEGENGDADDPYVPEEKPEPKNPTYRCKVCSKGYESKSGRRNHYVSAHNQFECKVCEELFQTSEEAEEHEKQPHKILCSLCPEYFQSQSSLKMHVSSKHLEGPKQYKCSQCNRDYVSKSALITHEKLHKIKEPSVCDVCNKCCKTPTALKYHKFVHMTDEEKAKVGFACTMCDKKFPGKTRLTLHMRRHTDERPCECPTCHKTFHDSERLKAHMEGHRTEKRFKCDQCEACFVSKRYLVNHMYLSHRRRQVIRCVVCKIVFPSLKEVMLHQQSHTPEEMEKNNAKSQPFTKSIEFHCKECNVYYPRKDLLRIHKARNHAKERVPNKTNVPIKQVECKLCGKKVWGTAGLNRHMRVHSNDAPARTFQCEFCAKLFAQKMQMVLHIRTHTGEKPFRCQFCDKGFINVNSLVVHERIHTGDNPFQCDKCPKAFRSNSNLVAHLQTHSDVKPYECHFCHKRFGRLIHLKLHLRTHTGERPYVCDICGRAFTQGGDMRKHRLTHTGERAYKCDVCDFSSNKRKTLTEHQAASHPIARVVIPPIPPQLHPIHPIPHLIHIQNLQNSPTDYPPAPPPPPQPSSSNYLKLYENWSEN